MSIRLHLPKVASVLAMAPLVGGTALAQASAACAGAPACMEARGIAATITDFRSSLGGNSTHIESATIHFANTTSHPVILGYVNGSGIATDDQGNRFTVWDAASVRGIGVINGSRADSKFSLQPGEGADARFELAWRPASRSNIFGTSWVLEFTVREIQPIGASQLKLGEEMAFHFPGLRGDGSGLTASTAGPAATAASSQGATTATAVAATASAAVAAGAPVVDPCAGVARCYNAGAFRAVITSMTQSKLAGNGINGAMAIIVRFQNLTSEPIVLAYTQASSSMVDESGKRWYWGRAGAPDRSISGIGMVTRSSADPQFVLRPGESRDAQFKLLRFGPKNDGPGSSFTYNVSIEQLQVLASQQVRPVRQYAVHFDNVTTGSAPNLGEAVNKLKSLFGKIKH
ncbi:MAG: hypothetical protein ABI026_07970 [Gemmatimonadaceae bacterium]